MLYLTQETRGKKNFRIGDYFRLSDFQTFSRFWRQHNYQKYHFYGQMTENMIVWNMLNLISVFYGLTLSDPPGGL